MRVSVTHPSMCRFLWQGLHFVSLETHTSWQAKHFVLSDARSLTQSRTQSLTGSFSGSTLFKLSLETSNFQIDLDAKRTVIIGMFSHLQARKSYDVTARGVLFFALCRTTASVHDSKLVRQAQDGN